MRLNQAVGRWHLVGEAAELGRCQQSSPELLRQLADAVVAGRIAVPPITTIKLDDAS